MIQIKEQAANSIISKRNGVTTERRCVGILIATLLSSVEDDQWLVVLSTDHVVKHAKPVTDKYISATYVSTHCGIKI